MQIYTGLCHNMSGVVFKIKKSVCIKHTLISY